MANVAALYSRVSTEEQVERGHSIPFQKESLEKEAKRQGLPFRHYSDEAKSGGSTNRASFLRMLADIETGEISKVIVFDLSRSTRDLKDLLIFQETLKDRGVELISLSEHIDLKTDEGDFLFKIKGVINERYRKDIAKRVSIYMHQKAKKGDFCGGQAPFGYVEDKLTKRLMIDKAESEVVKKMFNWFEQDPFYRGVTVRLNREGYRTKRGQTFAQSTVRRILTNPVYKGIQTFGKRPGGKAFVSQDKWLFAKGNFEPIISEEQFNRVQLIVKNKKREKRNTKHGIIYLLSTLMRCECGASINGYSQRKKGYHKLYSYYACHNNQSKGTCDRKRVKKTEIESSVIDYIKSYAKTHFEKSEIESVIKGQEINSAQEKLKRFNMEITKLESRKKKIYLLYEDDRVNKEDVINRIREIDTTLNSVKYQRDMLQNEISPKERSKREDVLERINKLNEDFDSLKEEVKRDILRQLIKGILLKKNGEIEIDLYEI